MIVTLLILAFVPIPYLAAPGWDVTVVDSSGTAQHGITVRRIYIDYSVEMTGHEDDLPTDMSGRVSFPPVSSNASLARCLAITVVQLFAGAHGSLGRESSLVVFGNGLEGDLKDEQYLKVWRGHPGHMNSLIRVH